jgi:2-oxoglutarate dehydrogenase E2 component (dihydrolipoamide succinyltransferase)
MDPHSEHGDSGAAHGLASASATDDGAEASERAEPVAAPADGVRPHSWQDAAQASEDATSAPSAAPSSDPDPAETLSPAVRRLVRQYDLDITGVYGSGPAGKIRVGDIIGMLDGRTEPRARTGEAPNRSSIAAADGGARYTESSAQRDARIVPAEYTESSAQRDARIVPAEDAPTSPESSAEPQGPHAVPTTTVFECDVSRVLSHRKRERERQSDGEPLLASYFIAACLEALSAVPEIAADSTPPQTAELAARLGVSIATTDGSLRRALVGAPAASWDERLRSVDAQLRASVDDDLRDAHILIHYYGASGSLLATPTAIGIGHAGSIGIGRVRREIVVRTVDGQEAPRVAALCYLTLTFRPERIALERANRFVGECVRVLEQWPTEPVSAG